MAGVLSSREGTGPLPITQRMQWSLLVACCVSSSAKLLEPPIWVFDPPGVQPFDAAWNDYRLISSISGILLVVFLLIGGAWGDLYGRRRFWLIGLTGHAASYLLLMVSPNPIWHVALRFCGMAFGAMFLPLVLATLHQTFTERNRAMAFSIYTIVNATAIQVAWLQGQYLATWLGWRAAYVLPVVFAIAAIVLVVRHVPEKRTERQRRFDLIVYSGWTLLVLAVVHGLAVLPVASDRWIAVVASATLVGVLGAVLVVWWEMRRPSEFVRLRRFQARELVSLIVTGAVIQFLIIGFGLRTLGLFQVVKGMSAVVAVAALAPVLLGLLIAVLLFLRTMERYRAREVIAGGLVVMAAAIALAALSAGQSSYLVFSLSLLLFGVGYLVASTVWTSAFLRSAVARHDGVNAAISSAASLIGGAVGSALTGNLLARLGLDLYLQSLTAANVEVAAALEALIAFKTLVLAEPADLAAVTDYMQFDLLSGYREAYAAAYSQILWLMVAFSMVTALIIRFGLRSSLRATVKLPVDEEVSMV